MAELQINTEPAVGNAADRVLPFPVVGSDFYVQMVTRMMILAIFAMRYPIA